MKNNDLDLRGVMPGYSDVEQKFYDDIKSMIKLRVESKLFADINTVLDSVSKKNGMYKGLGRHAVRIKNRALRRLDKSYKKGLREIDKNIPVFVELPKYEKKGNGYVIKSSDTKKKEEIIVEDLLQANSQAEITLAENAEVLSKEETKLIE